MSGMAEAQGDAMNTTTDLCSIACRLYGRRITDEAVDNPDFNSAKWLESWEWYVEPEIRELWRQLSPEGRWVACLGALALWRRENELAP